MSYWAPVKIRDTPRFSTVTLLIGLRSRYLRLASGAYPRCRAASTRRTDTTFTGVYVLRSRADALIVFAILFARSESVVPPASASTAPAAATKTIQIDHFCRLWERLGLIPPIAFEPFDRPRRLIIGNHPAGD
jgi:hypothetical protein